MHCPHACQTVKALAGCMRGRMLEGESSVGVWVCSLKYKRNSSKGCLEMENRNWEGRGVCRASLPWQT